MAKREQIRVRCPHLRPVAPADDEEQADSLGAQRPSSSDEAAESRGQHTDRSPLAESDLLRESSRASGCDREQARSQPVAEHEQSRLLPATLQVAGRQSTQRCKLAKTHPHETRVWPTYRC